MGDRAGVGVELAALFQRDQVAPTLGVEKQHPLAGLERPSPRAHGAAHRPPGGAGSLVARSTSRQKAHSLRDVVGAPQPGHGCSLSRPRRRRARPGRHPARGTRSRRRLGTG